MKHKAYLLALPTVVLASGCAEWALDNGPPQVPEAAGTWLAPLEPAPAEVWAPVPSTRWVTAPSSGELSARWLLPPGSAWAPYQKATLITALDDESRAADLPDVERLDVVADAWTAASAVANAGLPAGTMWVVDLRGAGSVAFAAALSQVGRQAVAPVLTFNNWPAENEFVPAEETLAALVAMRPLSPVAAGSQPIPVFLLDAWRLAYRYDAPDAEVTDNRYMLTPSDFPSADVLRMRGIERIVYVVEHLEPGRTEEDDLHETFLAYQRVGIEISIVDLEMLAATEPAARWVERIYASPLYVDETRETIVTDPHFYLRARGGFGGPRVIYGGWRGLGGSHGCFAFHAGG
jgi:hypothetical protein